MSTQQVPEWTFGDRVRKARREMGWSQADLADKLAAQLGSAVSTKSVGAWETDQNRPADVVEIARALEHVTRIPASWFLGLDDETQR